VFSADSRPTAADLSPEDAQQCITDIKESFKKTPGAPTPCPGTPPPGLDPVLTALLAEFDGLLIFDIRVFPRAEIKDLGGSIHIGKHDMDDDAVFLEDGVLMINGGPVNPAATTFGAYLALFRDKLVSNKCKWVDDAWIEEA